MAKILVIEDDRSIRDDLQDTLRFHGYEAFTAADGLAGLALVRAESPDLVVLDVMMPGPDGLDVCRKLRSEGNGVPIILLTALGSESDKLLGFELGADDYLTKPFSLKELMARIKAVLARSHRGAPSAERIAVGESIVDFSRSTVTRRNREAPLTAREAGVLRLLSARPGQVCSRETIIETVWGTDVYVTTRTVDNFILKLRAKVEEEREEPRHLLTVHGQGYKLVF